MPASPPRINSYRLRVWGLMRSILQPHLPLDSALDFGGGDGWFASCFEEEGWVDRVVAIDVGLRRHSFVDIRLYDGQRLPFENGSFDLAYSIDALHHCREPCESLGDLLRCSGRFLLLKDHTHRSCPGRLALAALDELGNRRFGVPSPHRYQRGWEWLHFIEDRGFERLSFIHPAPCHGGPLGWATNSLQFVGLWRRK